MKFPFSILKFHGKAKQNEGAYARARDIYPHLF